MRVRCKLPVRKISLSVPCMNYPKAAASRGIRHAGLLLLLFTIDVSAAEAATPPLAADVVIHRRTNIEIGDGD